MTRRIVLLAVVCWLIVPTTYQAAELGLGFRLGTQGVGAEGGAAFTEWFTVRAGLYGGSLSSDFDEGGIDYDGDLTVGGIGALADFFPWRGDFRLTAGFFSNNNEIEFDATPTAPIEVGDSLYNPADIGSLIGKVEFDSTAPYFGIGWGNIADGKRVGFLADIGFLAQGSPEVRLSRTSMTLVPGLDQDLAAEAAQIEDDIEEFDFWPVISVGVAIRF